MLEYPILGDCAGGGMMGLLGANKSIPEGTEIVAEHGTLYEVVRGYLWDSSVGQGHWPRNTLSALYWPPRGQ